MKQILPVALLFALNAFAADPVSVTVPSPLNKVNHGQAIAETSPGEYLICWYSGTTEANSDSTIQCSRSADRGRTWGMPAPAVAAGEQAIGAGAVNKTVGNVTLSVDSANRLWMIYGVVQTKHIIGINVCNNWGCGRVDARISTDGGRSWSKAVRFDDESGALPRARPVHTELGDLVPLYNEGGKQGYVRVAKLAAARAESAIDSEKLAIPGKNYIQPTLVPMADGRVRAYLRSSSNKFIGFSRLDPKSRAWSPAVATNLPNPGSAVDSFTDPDGDTVLIYNPSQKQRKELRLAYTKDGARFTEGCDLVALSEEDVAYPSVVRGSDGYWHITYSSNKQVIHHASFDEAWLKRCLGKQ